MCPRDGVSSPNTGNVVPETCTSGKYCPSGSKGDDVGCGGTDTCPTECAAGSYCPAKAPAELPCQYGYWTGTGG